MKVTNAPCHCLPPSGILQLGHILLFICGVQNLDAMSDICNKQKQCDKGAQGILYISKH